MPSPATLPPNRESPPETLERLYALWMISSLLFVLLVIVLTLLGTGRLRRHALAISEQAQATEELREELSRMRQELTQLQATAFAAGAPSQAPSELIADQPQHEPPPDSESFLPRPAAPVPTRDEAIAVLLEAALRPSDETGYELADPEAADRALREALDDVGDKRWSGKTWARLALVARLLDRDGPAELFARRATAANVFPRDYYEVSARRMLSQGNPTEAVVFANRLYADRPDDPCASLLLGEAYYMQCDLAAADLAVEPLSSTEGLGPPDKVRLGRLLVELERWDRLEALLNTLDRPRDADPTQLNFLRAVLAIQQDRLPEALAILDNLLAEHPGDYDFQSWRGVALLSARQFRAAREALAIADTRPDRPHASYWRGVLEVRTGNSDEAVRFFQQALQASQCYAPAWEALGTIALNRGDLPSAMQNLENAVAANPRRASAHFLIAIIHAKTLRPTATADALRAALGLDPTLIEQARQTDVIRRLFTDEELEALVGGSGDPASLPSETLPE